MRAIDIIEIDRIPCRGVPLGGPASIEGKEGAWSREYWYDSSKA